MNSNQPPANQSPVVYEDEISLVDIVNVLFRRKKLILEITIVVVCIGLIYAFSAKRVYKVETILLPPSFENIQALNVLNSSNVNSSKVFASFIGNINSRKLKKAFFDKNKIFDVLSTDSTQVLSENNNSKVFESFSKSFNVKVDKKTKSAQIVLIGTHKDKIGTWLDSLVEMGNQETKSQLVRNLQANINSKINSLKVSIASKRTIYKQRREDVLGRLEEAYQTAKSLGIRDYNNISSSSTNNSQLSIYLQEKKIYMQGTRIIQAEMNALKNRKSDDIHIAGLRDLQEQLTRLEIIKIEENNLQTFVIDKKAITNVEPIRPKRKLIVIFSLVLGGMLGVFAVFIMEFVGNFKKEVNNI